LKTRSTPVQPIDGITIQVPIVLRTEPAQIVIKHVVPTKDPPGYIIKGRPRAQGAEY